MALTYGNTATAVDINELKTRVNQELARRQYVGPLNGYVDSFTNAANAGTLIRIEHFDKTIGHINRIADTGLSASQGSIIEALQTASDRLDQNIAYNYQAESTDCNNSCTGLCYTSCSGACRSGCSGCQGCTNSCSGCTAACKQSCQGCTNACSGCTAACKNSCQGCSGSCSGGCQGGCTSCTGCSTSCDDGCAGGCNATCSGHGVACSSCAAKCQGWCTTWCYGVH